MFLQKMILFLFFLGSCLLAQSAPTLISETVGSLTGETLTTRDMILSDLFEKILLQSAHLQNTSKKPITAELRPPSSQADRIQAINMALLDKIVEKEAEAFKFEPDLAAEVQKLQNSVEPLIKAAPYKGYGFTQVEISKMSKRKSIVQAFLKSKSESFTSLLSDQDIQTYFEKNRMRFGTVPLNDVKENIRTFLSQQQRDERLRAWIEVVKKKYKAQNYLLESSNKKQ